VWRSSVSRRRPVPSHRAGTSRSGRQETHEHQFLAVRGEGRSLDLVESEGEPAHDLPGTRVEKVERILAARLRWKAITRPSGDHAVEALKKRSVSKSLLVPPSTRQRSLEAIQVTHQSSWLRLRSLT